MLHFFLLVALAAPNYAAYFPPRQLLIIPTPTVIVGGVETDIRDVPYQAAVLNTGLLLCGGSILKPKAVVTAAQCVLGLPTSFINVRAGSSHYNLGGQIISSSNFITHESYNGDYDISIIELSSTIIFSESAAPIALPPQELFIPAGSQCQTSGWGTAYQGGIASPVIQKAVTTTVDQDVCIKAYSSTRYQITPRRICAGLIMKRGKDGCEGDAAGSPLVIDNTLVGIASWGGGCADPGYPRIWTRVSEFINWIDDKLSHIV